MTVVTDHQHEYRRLSDEAVFCRGCGDIKTAEVARCALPHWQPTWVYVPPIYPTYPQWTSPYPWTFTTVTSSAPTLLGTSAEVSSSVTYDSSTTTFRAD